MSDLEREIKILKKLVKAQNKMIYHYRVGKPLIPEWVIKTFEQAKIFYEVDSIDEIK